MSSLRLASAMVLVVVLVPSAASTVMVLSTGGVSLTSRAGSAVDVVELQAATTGTNAISQRGDGRRWREMVMPTPNQAEVMGR